VELPGSGEYSSDCGRYQYIRWFEISPGASKVCTILGLNPVMPDAGKPDQTAGICLEFAKRLGYTKLVIVNLFALVSRGSEGVPMGAEPVGPDNDKWLQEVAAVSHLIVGAWGDYPGIGPRVRAVLGQLKDFDIHCVQANSNGSPRHPLAWRQKAPKLYRAGARGTVKKEPSAS
jgi:hypothetical protein